MKLITLSRKIKIILIITLAAIVYVITAFNSHGFYHADEHYQIIEFAGLKLGTHTPDDLAWEFKAQIRSAFQPVICFVLIKVFEIINITNPYNQAKLLRLLSAIFALVVILLFIRNTKNLIKDESLEIPYYLLSYFLWFIPFISVRFSSETWSGLFFLLGLALFCNTTNEEKSPFKIGLLFGISFLIRFQISFAILGFGLWLLFKHRSKLKLLLKMFSSFSVIVLLGLLLDSWFYGEIVFAPWNYFLSVFESGGSGFGTSPWYFYIVKLLSYPTYFIGIPLVLSLILMLIFKWNSLFLWCFIPFVIIHSFFPHKEERFLFPLVYLFPLILIDGYSIFCHLFKNRFLVKFANYLIIIVFVIINSIGIIAMGQKSAGIGRMEISKHIHDKYGSLKINLIYCSWANPYNPWSSLPVKFYLEDSLTDHRINNLCELNDSLYIDNAINLVVILKNDKDNIECSQVLSTNSFVFETQSIPKWIEKLNKRYEGFENHDILELYRFEGAK